MKNCLISHLAYPVGVKALYHRGILLALLVKENLYVNTDPQKHKTKKVIIWFKRKMRITNVSTFSVTGKELELKRETLLVK